MAAQTAKKSSERRGVFILKASLSGSLYRNVAHENLTPDPKLKPCTDSIPRFLGGRRSYYNMIVRFRIESTVNFRSEGRVGLRGVCFSRPLTRILDLYPR